MFHYFTCASHRKRFGFSTDSWSQIIHYSFNPRLTKGVGVVTTPSPDNFFPDTLKRSIFTQNAVRASFAVILMQKRGV